MPKVILTKILSQKSWSSKTILILSMLQFLMKIQPWDLWYFSISTKQYSYRIDLYGTLCTIVPLISQIFSFLHLQNKLANQEVRLYLLVASNKCRFSVTLQRLVAGQIIDQFGHKRYQKKRFIMSYNFSTVPFKNILYEVNPNI